MSAEARDRLVDTLLKEVLGGEAPPDLADRILARIGERPAPRRRLARTWPYLAAAAALLLVLLGRALLTAPADYPAPLASGDYRVEGGELRRGAMLSAGTDEAALALGGYCRVALAPAARVRLEGERRAEAVYLERGEVTCLVEPGQGEFLVRTEVGAVAVKGTEFLVRLRESDAAGRPAKAMLVRVRTGSVLVSGPWGERLLGAGDEGLADRAGCRDPRRAPAAAPVEVPVATVAVGDGDDAEDEAVGENDNEEEEGEDENEEDEDGNDEDEDGDTLTLEEVPPAVRSAIRSELGEMEIEEIEREEVDGRVVFEVEVEIPGGDLELVIGEDGTVLRRETEFDEDDEDDDNDGNEE